MTSDELTILVGILSVILGFVLGVWWQMRIRPKVRCKKVICAQSSENDSVLWNIEITNSPTILGPRMSDTDVRAELYIEKLHGSEPRQFTCKWFTTPQDNDSNAYNGGDVTASVKEGAPRYIPIAFKKLNQDLAWVCGHLSNDDSNRRELLDREPLDREPYAARIQLSTIGKPHVSWFLIINRDKQIATFEVRGPFKEFGDVKKMGRKLGLV